MLLVSLLTVSVFAAPVAAQAQNNSTTTPTANSTGTGTDTVEYQLSSDVQIVNVNWSAGGPRDVAVVIHATDRSLVTITDSGAVQSLSSNSGTGVTTRDYWVSEGTTTLTFAVEDTQLITVGSGDGLYASAGELSTFEWLVHAPTVALVQVGALSGAIGTFTAFLLAATYRRRQHENTYLELFSEDRVRVESSDPDGWIEKVKAWVSRHTIALACSAAIFLYLFFAALNVLPTPGEAWSNAGNFERVAFLGVVLFTVGMFIPAYAVLARYMKLATEYIVSFDIMDTLSVSAGSEGGVEEFLDDLRDDDGEIDVAEVVDGNDQVAISVYSGSPDRVSDLDVVEGEPTDVRSPGGNTQLVRQFDPSSNRAEGTWPGTADDALIAAEQSAISWNREVLEDESDAFRTLLGGLGALRSASNSSAAVALNEQLADATDIDPGPVNNILDRALASTRYAGYFTDDEDDNEDESYEDDVDGSDSDDDSESVNDNNGGDE